MHTRGTPRGLFGSIDLMAVRSKSLSSWRVKNTFMPFHPGAVRYYREIGITIPASSNELIDPVPPSLLGLADEAVE